MKIDLQLGDCLQLMQKIPDQSIDLILCDLPFNTTACEWDLLIPFEDLWKQYKRIRKDNTAIVLHSSQPFTTLLIQSNIQEFRYEWIWEKSNCSNPLTCKIMPLKVHENICIFYKSLPTYNPIMVTGAKPYKAYHNEEKKLGEIFQCKKSIHRENTDGSRFPRSVIQFPAAREGLHPTQKPLDLARYLIKTYSNEGDIVLDNCMGSGTTGLAAKILNRNFIGMEKDEKYYAIAKQRIESHKTIAQFFG